MTRYEVRASLFFNQSQGVSKLNHGTSFRVTFDTEIGNQLNYFFNPGGIKNCMLFVGKIYDEKKYISSRTS